MAWLFRVRKVRTAANRRFARLNPGRTMAGMKEMTTIRLYERPARCEWCDALEFRTTEAVRDWNLSRGDRVPLEERKGGYVEGVIDHVQPEIHEDRTGRFKLAVVWIQD